MPPSLHSSLQKTYIRAILCYEMMVFGRKKPRDIKVRRVMLNVNGAGERIRTSDLRITNALLYQLSYTGFHIFSCRVTVKRHAL